MPRTSKPLSGHLTLLIAALSALAVTTAATAGGRAQPRTGQDVVGEVVRDVCDRDVVLLGELPGHGEAVGFELKARIVRGLVERCGFDAVLFEAGIFDFLGFEAALAQGRARPAQLDDAIGGFWSNEELAAWRGWLFAQASRRALVVGGLDDQPGMSSHHARAVLPGLVAAVLPAPDAGGCEAAVRRNLEWTYDATHRFDALERARLQACAQQALATYAPGDASPERMMVESLFHYLARQNRSDQARERDESMHRALRWYRARLPAGSRVVVWTATTHASRMQGALRWRPLGERMGDEAGGRMAAIGFTALAGQSGRLRTPPAPLPALPPGSLEARALASAGAARYLDGEALRAYDGAPSRLFGTVQAAPWSDAFDGVVVVREERAPVFAASQAPAD